MKKANRHIGSSFDDFLKEEGLLPLTCPNCQRSMPNEEHRIKHGCKYCIQEKDR